MFDLYLTTIKLIAIFFLPLILCVLFKRSIIIFTLLFFLITRAFKIVLRSYCSCLFREGQNSIHMSHQYGEMSTIVLHYSSNDNTQFWGNVVWQLAVSLCCQGPSSKRMVPSPKNCHQNIIIATLYRTVVVCRLSLQMFSKYCRFRHNTVPVKSFLLTTSSNGLTTPCKQLGC